MNGLADWTGHGLMWHPKLNPSSVIFTSFIDWTWFMTGFFIPILQSAYFVYQGKKHKTHDLIIKISDNRVAAPSANVISREPSQNTLV